MKHEVAIVGGKRWVYVLGDTTPPPKIRRCKRCSVPYDAAYGRVCDCFEAEYREAMKKEGA